MTLPIPEKEGHDFIGWFTGDGANDIKYSNFTPVLEDLTLYAKWEINQYTMNFDSDGGSLVSPITQDFDSDIHVSEPSKEGYTFLGWHPEVPSTMPAEDLTFTAQWQINQYHVTYVFVSSDYNPLQNILLNLGEKITKLSLYNSHSSAITSEGRLFIWGENWGGQLGDGTTISRYKPVEITPQFNLYEEEMIIQISLGTSHSAALTSEGRIFTWGWNQSGQLGDGTTTTRHSPIEITSQFRLKSNETIIEVSLGDSHSSAITSEGRLFTWGENWGGQLGIYTATDKSSIPIDITSQFNLNVGEIIIQTSLNSFNSSVITSVGRIFTWGYNETGQLGDGTTITRYTPVEITLQFILNVDERIIQVSLGASHSSAITSEGRIFTWGYNETGQLGDGTNINRYTPVEITPQFNLNEEEAIVKVSLGASRSSAITSEGRIYTWGFNKYYGQLGDGTTTNRYSPIEITSQFNLNTGEGIVEITLGSYISAAITSEGRIYTWGRNEDGQLGDGTTITRITPVEIGFYTPKLDRVVTYTYQDDIDLDYAPLRDGYTFDGWYKDSTLYTNTTMPAEDITLYGKWIKD